MSRQEEKKGAQEVWSFARNPVSWSLGELEALDVGFHLEVDEPEDDPLLVRDRQEGKGNAVMKSTTIAAVLFMLVGCGGSSTHAQHELPDLGKLTSAEPDVGPARSTMDLGTDSALDADAGSLPVPPPLNQPDAGVDAMPPAADLHQAADVVIPPPDVPPAAPQGTLIVPGGQTPATALAVNDSSIFLGRDDGLFRVPLTNPSAMPAPWGGAGGTILEVREITVKPDGTGAIYAANPSTLFLVDAIGSTATALSQGWNGIAGLAAAYLPENARLGVTAQGWVSMVVPASGDVVLFMDPPSPQSPKIISGQENPSAVAMQLVAGAPMTYWANQNSGDVLATDGHSTSTPASGEACPSFVAVDQSSLYVLTGRCTGSGKLVRAALDGSGTEVLVAQVSGPAGLLAVQGGIFWLQDGAVMSMPAPGVQPVVKARTGAPCRSLAANSTDLYWIEGGDVRRTHLAF